MSVKAKEIQSDGLIYRDEQPFTGDESRAAEVTNVEFPQLLTPIDDLPPVTVITHLIPHGDKLLILGVVSDNGQIAKVLVNGQQANLEETTGLWEIEIPIEHKELKVFSVDVAGNAEQLPHLVTLK